MADDIAFEKSMIKKRFKCRSLLKQCINSWNEDTNLDGPTTNVLKQEIDRHHTEICEATLNFGALKVAPTVAGFVAKKLARRSK